VGKYGKAGRTTDDNMMLHSKDAFCIQHNSDNSTETHLHFLIFIAFPRQQWLRERASILCYTYIAYLILLRG
jgi:hypothetical protein